MHYALRLAALAAGAAALVAGLPLHARDINSWQVARSKQGACMMTATFDDESEGGVALSLVWDKAKSELGFVAASKHWNQLIAREGNPTDLQLIFDGQVKSPMWIYENAHFQTIGSGTEAVMGVWGEEHRSDFADAFTGSRSLALSVGDTDVGAFDISGADEAYRELLRCGERG